MVLHKAQAKIAEDTHRFRVLCCGRRFGKTTLAVEEIKGKALSKPQRIAYVAPTYQQARDIAWEMLKRELQAITIQANESRLELRVYTQDKEESTVVLRGWESIETLRGQQFDFIIVDEVAMMRNFDLNWQEIIRPTLTDTRGEGMFISTPKGFNHFYELYNLARKDKDYASFHFTTRDNPFIPRDEIEKAREELTEDRFAQEYLADFRKTEGLVYKEFEREKHVFGEPGFEGQDFVTVKKMAGVDFGFNNPACILTIYKDKDANYWVMDEWYKSRKTDAEIADYANGLQLNEYYPDPENAGGIEELKRRKLNVRDVVKSKSSVKNGINTVAELFKADRIYIHKECHNLIWELETYSYPDKKPDRNEEENPIKENDHAVDALRYCLMMESVASPGGVKIIRPNAQLNTVAQAQAMMNPEKALNKPEPVGVNISRGGSGYRRYRS